MKTCMICEAIEPDDAPTCSMCGEASWGETGSEAPANETKASRKAKVKADAEAAAKAAEEAKAKEAADEQARLDALKAKEEPECVKCTGPGSYKPCSVECYVKAGYKAEDYEKCVADCEARHAKALAEAEAATKPADAVGTG